MEFIIGLAVLGLVVWGLAKLTDFFEERSFLFWLVLYLIGGGLLIVALAMAKTLGKA